MSFKLHLIIISVIVVVVLLAWQIMQHTASAPTVAAPATTHYSLTVIHASWGLNCRNTGINATETRGAFARKGDAGKALREDNVLGAIAPMCNGKMQCEITADEATLGKDPAPDCMNKALEVEYRCFSYDRPWKAESSTGTLSLRCEQPSD